MTTTETLYPILDLEGNACKASRAEIEDLIANVEASKMVKAALEDDVVLMNAYIRGKAADGTTFRSIREQSDYALLKLWHEELREQAIELKASSMGLRWDIELQGDPEATEPFQWGAEPLIEIEGKDDGEVIKIGRWALIRRLIAYQMEIDHHPALERDVGWGYMEALENGLKGFAEFGIDELKEEWEEIRTGFYRRNEGNALTGKLDVEDPEYGDLVEDYADGVEIG